jgi:hypothetical protein
MPRKLAIHACVACALAAAAAGAPAQPAGSGLVLGLASREAAGPAGRDPVLQLKLRAGDAAREQASEAGAALDVRQAIGPLGSVRELTLYGIVREGDWRWQASLTRDLLGPDVSVGLRVRRSF